MVPLTSLVLPILLSAVAVFLVSSVVHMVLKYHKNDVRGMLNEDAVMDALRPFNLAPGDYAMPMAGSMEGMKAPAFVEKLNRGPVVFMTVVPPGPSTMNQSLALWFGYSVLVSLFAAYVSSRALPPDAAYLQVFRFAGTTAFGGYALALMQNSIWYRMGWGRTFRSMADGLLYGLVTGGVFGWLW